MNKSYNAQSTLSSQGCALTWATSATRDSCVAVPTLKLSRELLVAGCEALLGQDDIDAAVLRSILGRVIRYKRARVCVALSDNAAWLNRDRLKLLWDLKVEFFFNSSALTASRSTRTTELARPPESSQFDGKRDVLIGLSSV